MSSRLRYEVLTAPMSEDFCEWYPYLSAENMVDENPAWTKWLQRAVRDEIPGIKNVYITSRDEERNKYVGVTWCAIPIDVQELAHFGWFFVDAGYRGMGIGREIVNLCEQHLNRLGIKVIMLPTTTKTEPAYSFYLRRGWMNTIVDPANGYCFMVKEPSDYYQKYFFSDENVEVSELNLNHFISIDYLLNRNYAISRLYPLGSIGAKRFISFEQDWEGYETFVAIQKNRVTGICVFDKSKNLIDIFSFNPMVMDVLLKFLIENRKERQLKAYIAELDLKKEGIFLKYNFRNQRDFVKENIGFRLYANEN